jgi:phosphate transport system protein
VSPGMQTSDRRRSVPREAFEAELAALKERLLQLGTMAAEAQRSAVQALVKRDEGLAHDVIARDQAINQLQRQIEEECVFLIASQQPVARDLRIIIAVSEVASELERMADHAKGIAKLTLRLIDQPMLKPLIDIPRMDEIGREMLLGQLQAFLTGDVEAARQLARRDDEVDQLNDQVFRELLLIMMNDPRTITRATYLLWVAHDLERFSDRATNIGERVVFVTAGDIVELND